MTTQLYQSKPYKVSFDTNKYPFKEVIQQMLGVEDIPSLHLLKSYEVFKRETDQSSIWHKKYYEAFSSLFRPLYLDFLKNFVSPEFGIALKDLIFQQIPTFRVHLVGNVSVGEWHRDRDYNHGSTEMNFWLPFADTSGTNTVWMETEEGKGDIRPFALEYGQILCFNGADLIHGNKINKSDRSRVSVDFRIVHRDKFAPSTEGSINTGVKFDIGGYFSYFEEI